MFESNFKIVKITFVTFKISLITFKSFRDIFHYLAYIVFNFLVLCIYGFVMEDAQLHS